MGADVYERSGLGESPFRAWEERGRLARTHTKKLAGGTPALLYGPRFSGIPIVHTASGLSMRSTMLSLM